MHPELLTLPGGFSIKMYGACLCVGFLSAVWLSMRRATRVKADPDMVLNLSFLALLFGVGGARIFYVIHYWNTQFADVANPILAIIDIRQGGLEFLGGLLGAIGAIVIYLAIKKQSVRLYLDILAPGAMWGLAFGRLGCFFNGCCFGGICATGPMHQFAAEFPFSSPAHVRHWEERDLTVPAELIVTSPRTTIPFLLSDSLLSMSVERRETPQREYDLLKDQQRRMTADAADAAKIASVKVQLDGMEKSLQKHNRELAPLRLAQRFPSRVTPSRRTSVSELEELAAQCRSAPIHATQLYSSINAMLLSAVLSAVFYLRKRHGVVVGVLFLMYPIPRAILELVRADNPRDIGGLTISQFVSLSMLVVGVAYLVVLYKKMPRRSPLADAARPPMPPTQK